LKIPEQVTRIAAVGAIIAAGAVGVRFYFVPQSYFSREVHQQTTVAREIAKPISFAGSLECRDCHDDVTAKMDRGYHKTLGCESCHGPGTGHVDDPEGVKVFSPRDRKFCPVCHAYDSARPTGFPQITVNSHNPRQPCIKCHSPHDPVPPHVPQECSACHGQIERTKALSSHALVKCTVCHEVGKEHKISPRSSTATKPETRAFCGTCHAEGSPNADMPKVDMTKHGGSYLCWQCHYAHLPEGS